ncbi:winged helix-turn-helix transcriptional regulator, partial [Candidatus Peregrinibacteria bacterium]|nr:winged helix-turn-helix transcriptional regulator [Candidatus Peregrinibacteria bacterium]
MNFKDHLLSLLKKIGLTDSEAQCYLIIQKNPELTINELVKKSDLSRAQVYRVFERLQNLNLVTSSSENWRQTLRAASLNGLANRVGLEQRKLRKAELELKRLSNLMEFSKHVQMDDPVEIVTDPEQIAQKAF